MKPASIRGPIFVIAPTVPRRVPIGGAVRSGELRMRARDAGSDCRASGVRQLTQKETDKRSPHRHDAGTDRTSESSGLAEAESFFTCVRSRSGQLSGSNPRLANDRVNSSLNAGRREYVWRRPAAHVESSASRPFGATATHDATRRAAWP